MQDLEVEQPTTGLSSTENDNPTVLDREAFAKKYMPDLGHNVIDFQTFAWSIQRWSNLENRMTSPEFECGGHRLRLLFFPSGNASDATGRPVSIYLDYANGENTPDDWHACTQFMLVMSNPRDPSVFLSCHAHHRFCAEEPDWGFTRFNEMAKLLHSTETRPPIIEDGNTVITVFVRTLEDLTGTMWHNFVNYNSKKATGFTHLQGEHACFLDSLVQSLYCTGSFRHALFQIPSEDEVPAEGTMLALQRLFYNLQTSDRPCSTRELTQSLGLKSTNPVAELDVQDFIRLLNQRLDPKMKNTPLGSLMGLLRGEVVTRLKCVNVAFESSRVEDYDYIQLEVKGMKNLRESLQSYCAPKTLDGTFAYEIPGHGPHHAEKSSKFLSLPPVLHLGLRRLGYDMETSSVKKINDRHEYPREIDMAEFLDESADKTQSYNYRLHAALAHSGDSIGGAYSALIKPEPDAQWLLFDSDRVTLATEKMVLEDNYGGETACRPGYPPPVVRDATAYMLVYVRESMINEVLLPRVKDEIPLALQNRFKEEQFTADDAERHKQEVAEWFVSVRIVTDSIIQQHRGFDLAILDDEYGLPTELPVFRVPKTELYSTFKSRVTRHFGLGDAKFRLWLLNPRQNKTIRPDIPVPEDAPDLTVEFFRSEFATRSEDLRLYLDLEDGASSPLSALTETIMIFAKFFDVWGQCIRSCRKFHIWKRSKVSDLAAQIDQVEGWRGARLKLYEEVKPNLVELMDQDLTFVESEIQDGDIVCYQFDLSEEEVLDVEGQGFFSTAEQYYAFIRNRTLVTFKPLEGGSKAEQFDLALSKETKYKDLLSKVGQHLQFDSSNIRLQGAHSNGFPKAGVIFSDTETISDVFKDTSQASPVIFYEKRSASPKIHRLAYYTKPGVYGVP